MDQLEDKEVGAAASRHRDLDCVPTSLANLSQQHTVKYFFFEVPMVLKPSTQYFFTQNSVINKSGLCSDQPALFPP